MCRLEIYENPTGANNFIKARKEIRLCSFIMECSPEFRITIRHGYQAAGCNYCLDSASDRNLKKLAKGSPVPLAAIGNAIGATNVIRKSLEGSLHPR